MAGPDIRVLAKDGQLAIKPPSEEALQDKARADARLGGLLKARRKVRQQGLAPVNNQCMSQSSAAFEWEQVPFITAVVCNCK